MIVVRLKPFPCFAAFAANCGRPGIFSVLQVWDIGGQSINSKLIGGYISGSAAIFVCYDVTDPSSFSDALDWLKVAKRHSADATGKSSAQV